MKRIDKYSWIANLRYGMASVLLGAVLLFTGTIVEAGVFKLDLKGCKAGPDNGYHMLTVPDIHPGHPDINMYFCDYDAYTEGNLKQWAELDMVPHGIVISNTTGSDQNFTFKVGGDYKDANDPDIVGWDYITELTLDVTATRLLAVRDGLDPDIVEASCKAVGKISTQTIEISNDESEIFRLVDVKDFPTDLKCVPVYNMRLAIGSSNYSGSSLQSRLISVAGAGNVGDQTLPLPDVLATGLSKTMSAVQGGSRSWSVSKSASLATVDFGDTCDPATPLNKDVQITVNWVKGDVTPAGSVTVTTIISASNTAQREINISVTDRLYSGTTLLDTHAPCQATLPANTANYEVCTNTFTVAEAQAINLNDIATATYSDPDAPSGTITAEINASASAIVQGSEDNTDENATITDNEWISGDNLSYSVADPGSGSFDNYTAGVNTTDDITWISDLQTGSSSVTFTKTVHTVTGAEVSGTLSDLATLKGSDGFGTSSGEPLIINLISSPSVQLTITKTMDPVYIPDGETLDFNFTIRNALGYENNITLSVNDASDTNSTTIALDPGLYNVKELTIFGYTPLGDATRIVNLNLPTCAATEIFENVLADRPAVKVRKITLPPGNEAGWEMTLYEQNLTDQSWTQIATGITIGTDWITLAAKNTLQKGTYKIEETMQVGWYEVGRDVDCEFTYDPADGNRSDFECIYANAEYAEIIINKVVDGSSSTAFTFDQDINASIPLSLNDGESQIYNNLIPGTYHVTETDPAVNDLLSDHYLNALECVEAGGLENSVTDLNLQVATIQLEPGETVECTFTNQERGKINVLKTEDGNPATQIWTFSLEGIEGIVERTTDVNGVLNFEEIRLTSGRTYTLCEVDLHVGWDAVWMLDGSVVTPDVILHEGHVDRCYDFVASVGHTALFTIDNIAPAAEINIEKFTNNIDADTGTGPVIPVGSIVNWIYVVTNFGDVNVINVNVTDDQGVAVSCPKTTLDINESMTCTGSGLAMAGQYTNIGTVTATTVSDPVEDVSDSDTSHYLGEVLNEIARIGDFVWYDDNNNGIRDNNEEAVRGFTATLLDVNGNAISTQLTDANGGYGFDVAPGTYSVRFSGLTPEYIFSTKQNNSVADSNGNTEQVTVGSGESRLDRDAGIFCITQKSGSSSSGDAMGKLSATLMILMTLMVGLFFVRREEQHNKNRI